MNRIILGCIIMPLMVSCASSYKRINPSFVHYSNSHNNNGIQLDYRYNVLAESGNKKYSNKEIKNNIYVVAVKVTNTTNNAIEIGKDVQFGSANGINVIDPNQTLQFIRQKPASYLFYLPLWFLTFSSTSSSSTGQTETNTFPIGLIIGPAITFGNMGMAADANKQFKNELIENNLNGRVVKPNETVVGLISIQSYGFTQLILK
jgi:hypothetical protein